jgi:hypothetical protein
MKDTALCCCPADTMAKSHAVTRKCSELGLPYIGKKHKEKADHVRLFRLRQVLIVDRSLFVSFEAFRKYLLVDITRVRPTTVGRVTGYIQELAFLFT